MLSIRLRFLPVSDRNQPVAGDSAQPRIHGGVYHLLKQTQELRLVFPLYLAQAPGSPEQGANNGGSPEIVVREEDIEKEYLRGKRERVRRTEVWSNCLN